MRCGSFAALCVLLTCSRTGAAGDRHPVLYLLPEGFGGWVCVDYGVAGAAPLPREGDALLIRPRSGEILRTSDKADDVSFFGEARIEVQGARRSLPADVYGRRLSSRSDSKDPVQRRCIFFGDEDAADAAGDPPGIEGSPNLTRGVSTEERDALIGLYEATNGNGWKHRVGWLGSPGTECTWHGVDCGVTDAGKTVVVGLDLSNNNLVGGLPKVLEYLTQLERAHLSGNRLTGRLPVPLLDRWLAGALEVSSDTSLLTSVSKIEYETKVPSLLCEEHRIVLGADDTVHAHTRRCRQATPDDRTTFCEIKKGRLFPGEFARLGLLLERSGFFDLRPEYSRTMTHGEWAATRVIRGGVPFQVSTYATRGPMALWSARRAIDGVAAGAEWEKVTKRAECPKSSLLQ